MIQRIQSVWLLLASIVAFLSLKFPFYTGHIINKTTNQLQDLILNGKTNILLTIFTVAVAVAAIIFIFLYKDRKRQQRFTTVGLFLSIALIGLYIWQMQRFANGNFALTSLLVFVIPFFYLLAIRGISKDEKLVKSADRLR